MFDTKGWTYLFSFGSAKVYGRGNERVVVDKGGYATHQYTSKIETVDHPS